MFNKLKNPVFVQIIKFYQNDIQLRE